MKNLTLFGALVIALTVTACSDSMVSPEAVSPSADVATEADVAPSDFPENLESANLVLQQAWSPAASASSQTVSIQVIHNAADRRAFYVDVYVNGAKALDNFRFRTATPFLELPTSVSVAIAPWNSTSVDDAIATFDFDLPAGEKFVVVAAGVLKETRFNKNPEGRDVGFNLYAFAPARMAAEDGSSVDLLVFHGSTDAPTVGVTANGGVLIPGFGYGDFVGYASVPPASYRLGITAGGKTVRRFKADLSGLGGGAATVLASGLLTPPGPRFSLIAVLADGTVVKLPEVRKRHFGARRPWHGDRDRDDDGRDRDGRDYDDHDDDDDDEDDD